MRRTPSWGAWIEIAVSSWVSSSDSVAPPRGVRGLKFLPRKSLSMTSSRTPSWGAWIEIEAVILIIWIRISRTPSWGAWIEMIRLHF